MKKIFLLIIVTIILLSCNGPTHEVYEGNSSMIIYNKKMINQQHGRYEYWITDATDQPWKLKSFSNYDVGDTLKIISISK